MEPVTDWAAVVAALKTSRSARAQVNAIGLRVFTRISILASPVRFSTVKYIPTTLLLFPLLAFRRLRPHLKSFTRAQTLAKLPCARDATTVLGLDGEFFDRALVDCVEQKDMLCRAGRGIGEDFADHVLRFRVIAQGYERLLDGRRFFRRKLRRPE